MKGGKGYKSQGEVKNKNGNDGSKGEGEGGAEQRRRVEAGYRQELRVDKEAGAEGGGERWEDEQKGENSIRGCAVPALGNAPPTGASLRRLVAHCREPAQRKKNKTKCSDRGDKEVEREEREVVIGGGKVRNRHKRKPEEAGGDEGEGVATGRQEVTTESTTSTMASMSGEAAAGGEEWSETNGNEPEGSGEVMGRAGEEMGSKRERTKNDDFRRFTTGKKKKMCVRRGEKFESGEYEDAVCDDDANNAAASRGSTGTRGGGGGVKEKSRGRGCGKWKG